MEGKETLKAEISDAAALTRKLGWKNYVSAYAVASIAIAGSIAATIVAAVDGASSTVTAVIAAIPAAVLAVNTTFNFERKAIWHWRTTKRFEALIRKLEHEGATEEEVSQEFSALDLETFDGWISYSNLSKEKESIEEKGGTTQ